MLGCIRDLGYFCSSDFFFSSFKRLYITFSFATMVHILFTRENGIFIKQWHDWLDVNGQIVLSL